MNISELWVRAYFAPRSLADALLSTQFFIFFLLYFAMCGMVANVFFLLWVVWG